MKVKVGDPICSHDFGPGTIVAMTKEWCIFLDEGKNEIAVPWEDVYIDAEPDSVASSIEDREI